MLFYIYMCNFYTFCMSSSPADLLTESLKVALA